MRDEDLKKIEGRAKRGASKPADALRLAKEVRRLQPYEVLCRFNDLKPAPGIEMRVMDMKGRRATRRR